MSDCYGLFQRWAGPSQASLLESEMIDSWPETSYCQQNSFIKMNYTPLIIVGRHFRNTCGELKTDSPLGTFYFYIKVTESRINQPKVKPNA